MKNNKLALMTAGVLALAACDSNEMARNIGHGAAEELAQQGKELVGKLGKELIKEHAQRKTQKTEQQTKTSGVVDYPQTDIHPDSSLELDCNNVLYKNITPAVSWTDAENFFQICFSENAVGYSTQKKIGVWSAEHLTREKVKRAEKQDRIDSFHEEEQVPASQRALLSDYAGSGYDRGHLFPNGDTTNRESQYESFSLANMIPQSQKHNRGIWSSLESKTRKAAKSRGEVYVVTGSATIGKTKTIGNGVVVPTHVWKAIYFPMTNEAGAVLTENKDNAQYEYVSVNELKSRISIDPFPQLDNRVKDMKMKW